MTDQTTFSLRDRAIAALKERQEEEVARERRERGSAVIDFKMALAAALGYGDTDVYRGTFNTETGVKFAWGDGKITATIDGLTFMTPWRNLDKVYDRYGDTVASMTVCLEEPGLPYVYCIRSLADLGEVLQELKARHCPACASALIPLDDVTPGLRHCPDCDQWYALKDDALTPCDAPDVDGDEEVMCPLCGEDSGNCGHEGSDYIAEIYRLRGEPARHGENGDLICPLCETPFCYCEHVMARDYIREIERLRAEARTNAAWNRLENEPFGCPERQPEFDPDEP